MRPSSSKTVEIDGDTFSQDTLEIMMGEKKVEEINEGWKPVVQAIEEPDELPYLLSEINEVEPTPELRMALLRVQVNAQLKMKKDMDYYKRQLFTAKTIEVLLYKRLRLKPISRKRPSKES